MRILQILILLLFPVTPSLASNTNKPYVSLAKDGVYFKGFINQNEILLCFVTNKNDHLNGDFGINVDSNKRLNWKEKLPFTMFDYGKYFNQPAQIKLHRIKSISELISVEIGICKSLEGVCLPVVFEFRLPDRYEAGLTNEYDCLN